MSDRKRDGRSRKHFTRIKAPFFGFVLVFGVADQMRRSRRTKWNQRVGKVKTPPVLPASRSACQPTSDLAINLEYKRSLISGPLILKWIIISLHQSSQMNVKCLQLVR